MKFKDMVGRRGINDNSSEIPENSRVKRNEIEAEGKIKIAGKGKKLGKRESSPTSLTDEDEGFRAGLTGEGHHDLEGSLTDEGHHDLAGRKVIKNKITGRGNPSPARECELNNKKGNNNFNNKNELKSNKKEDLKSNKNELKSNKKEVSETVSKKVSKKSQKSPVKEENNSKTIQKQFKKELKKDPETIKKDPKTAPKQLKEREAEDTLKQREINHSKDLINNKENELNNKKGRELNNNESNINNGEIEELNDEIIDSARSPLTGKFRTFFPRLFPSWGCDRCELTASCDFFKPGYKCAFEDILKNAKINDIEEIPDILSMLANAQLRRLQKAIIIEGMSGGSIDPVVSNLIEATSMRLERFTASRQSMGEITAKGDGIGFLRDLLKEDNGNKNYDNNNDNKNNNNNGAGNKKEKEILDMILDESDNEMLQQNQENESENLRFAEQIEMERIERIERAERSVEPELEEIEVTTTPRSP